MAITRSSKNGSRNGKPKTNHRNGKGMTAAAHTSPKPKNRVAEHKKKPARGSGQRNLHSEGMIEAIQKSAAVIEFEMDGTIITANKNFLNTVGYSLEEIEGQHHRMFVDENYRNSVEYREFWAKLNRGEFDAGEYKRYGKDRRVIWLQASYNPIFDANGDPCKVVKFASDITEQVKARLGKAMIESAPTKVIMADRDLNIVSMNPSSKKTLETLKEYLPVPIEKVVGSSIDIFHKNPAYQRKILSDPKNLPHRANIQIGPETADLLVSAIYNEQGDYMGPMLTWEVVTAKIKMETEQARLQAMVENSPTNVMLADKDLNIVYANPASMNTLKEIQQYLPVPVTRIVGSNIDIFHKNPTYQRKILSDPKNLPHRANIQIGPETADLLVSAIYDNKGNYMGPMLTWELITQQLEAKEREKNLMSGIATNAATLAASSEELSATSKQMARDSEETANQANAVSAAAEQVSQNVQMVASGAEEMSVTVNEVSKSAAEAAQVASEAVSIAEKTSAIVSNLGESSDQIGAIVKVINSIAEQTNLLALNATIEAARAGEAGKGFAVVANEVKELAKETAKATEEISKKIKTIQSDTGHTVTAIKEIGNIISRISDISNSIAGAVEEQSCTTKEMVKNITEAATGSSEIADNIKKVAELASSNNSGATSTLTAAQSLAEMASQQQLLMDTNKRAGK